MAIVLGADHAGYALKEFLKKELENQHIRYKDVSPKMKAGDDYPDHAQKVAKAVSSGKADAGILVCGTGIGMSIAANRFKNVRAAHVCNKKDTILARKHNNANILCLGGRTTGKKDAKEILKAWITTPFEGGRHERRVKKLK